MKTEILNELYENDDWRRDIMSSIIITSIVIGLILTVVTLGLTLLTISKGYEYKHTIDPAKEGDEVREFTGNGRRM